ncbi:hypothetical protein OKW29_000566 [Paraburkholderia sp. CI3]
MNIRLATTDRYKDKASGKMKEATEWHRVAFFGRLAEIVAEYLKKGSPVYLEGKSLRIRATAGPLCLRPAGSPPGPRLTCAVAFENNGWSR